MQVGAEGADLVGDAVDGMEDDVRVLAALGADAEVAAVGGEEAEQVDFGGLLDVS